MPATLIALLVDVTITSAGTARERVGDASPFETSLGAGLLAAGIASLPRATPFGPRRD
ncbi:hypothetical protein [Methylorubrum suomiense]|uniref:Uncharacterized protein n=1 Tax=Methylorubrum suomiense TaxID=144191 RepID=A0ABQ4UU30_9HYPH|nr:MULTISPECIES: hypothetical protein [Methylobacteriaceae]GJE75500.1 hypothetical protein BGCPKDLD_2084 [Methylorubrum suomiense]